MEKRQVSENNKKNGASTVTSKSSKATLKKTSKDAKPIKEFKNKVTKLEEAAQKATTENDNLKDQLLRKMAEFDNYKRRTEKEFIDNIQSASKELIEELLPVIDDFERSINHAESEKEKSPLLDGVKLVYKNLMKTLTQRGLSEIDAINNEFNPDEHDALMQVDSKKHESGYVVDVHLKGYKMNDKVIRHAQVMVSK